MKKEYLLTISYIVEVDEELLKKDGKPCWELIHTPFGNRFPRRMKLVDKVWAKRAHNSMIALDFKGHNCFKCECCGRWVSCRKKPDTLPLGNAYYIDDKVYCVQCSDDILAGIKCKHTK